MDFVDRMLQLQNESIRVRGDGFPLESLIEIGIPYFPANSIHTGPFDLGTRISYIPLLGEVILMTTNDHPFYAYIANLKNGERLGFIRISNYNPSPENLKIFSTLISYFEEETDILVIDQVRNAGGSMFFMYAYISMLISETVDDLPLHLLAVNDGELDLARDNLERAEFGDDWLDERPSEETLAFSKFIIEEDKAGRRKTGPTHLGGVKEIKPAAIHYSKKVVILVDAGTISAGEFLAAILQDNKKALIFGTTTAGAGGCMKRFGPSPHSKAFLTTTWTLAIRPDGTYIENNGITPDVVYEYSTKDIQSDGAYYKLALLTAIENWQFGFKTT